MTRFNTYGELAEAFRSGTLDSESYVLTLDNDSCYLSFIGECASEEECERKMEACSDWFHGNGYSDLQQACEAAGIPAEWC